MKKIILISALVLSSVAAVATLIVSGERPSSAAAVPASTPPKVPAHKGAALTPTYAEYDGVTLVRTEAQWKKLLSPQAFYVLRKEGTERESVWRSSSKTIPTGRKLSEPFYIF
jgi:hypothetical protein